jgi:hypothetical protein
MILVRNDESVVTKHGMPGGIMSPCFYDRCVEIIATA